MDRAPQHTMCQHPDPACRRAADYEVRGIGTTPSPRRHAFCTEHVHGDLVAIRRTAEDDRTLDYEVVALGPGRSEIAFWPSDRRASLKIALMVLAIVVLIAGFAVLAPIMINA